MVEPYSYEESQELLHKYFVPDVMKAYLIGSKAALPQYKDRVAEELGKLSVFLSKFGFESAVLKGPTFDRMNKILKEIKAEANMKTTKMAQRRKLTIFTVYIGPVIMNKTTNKPEITLEEKDSDIKSFDMAKELRNIAKQFPDTTYFINVLINIENKDNAAASAAKSTFGALGKGLSATLAVTTTVVTLGQVDLKKKEVKEKVEEDNVNFMYTQTQMPEDPNHSMAQMFCNHLLKKMDLASMSVLLPENLENIGHGFRTGGKAHLMQLEYQEIIPIKKIGIIFTYSDYEVTDERGTHQHLESETCVEQLETFQKKFLKFDEVRVYKDQKIDELQQIFNDLIADSESHSRDRSTMQPVMYMFYTEALWYEENRADGIKLEESTRASSIASANSFFDEMMEDRERYNVFDSDAPFGIVTNDKRGFPLQTFMNFLACKNKTQASYLQCIQNKKVSYDSIKENPFLMPQIIKDGSIKKKLVTVAADTFEDCKEGFQELQTHARITSQSNFQIPRSFAQSKSFIASLKTFCLLKLLDSENNTHFEAQTTLNCASNIWRKRPFIFFQQQVEGSEDFSTGIIQTNGRTITVIKTAPTVWSIMFSNFKEMTLHSKWDLNIDFVPKTTRIFQSKDQNYVVLQIKNDEEKRSSYFQVDTILCKYRQVKVSRQNERVQYLIGFASVFVVFSEQLFMIYDIATGEQVRPDALYEDDLKAKFPGKFQAFKCSDREVCFATGNKLFFALVKETKLIANGNISVNVINEDHLETSPQVMKVENFDAMLIASSIMEGCIYMVDKKTGDCVRQFMIPLVDKSFNISMQLMTGFDYSDGYPFIVVRHHHGFSIVNLKTSNVQRFITEDKHIHTGRFTYMMKSRSGNAGCTIMFMSVNKNGTFRICRMNLDFDFNVTVRKIGGLPPENMLETLSKLLDERNEMTQKLRDLEAEYPQIANPELMEVNSDEEAASLDLDGLEDAKPALRANSILMGDANLDGAQPAADACCQIF